MWFNSMWEPAKTDEEYREKLRKRKNFIPCWVISGAAAIVVSVLLMRSGEDKDFLSGVYMGLGCAVLAGSVKWFLKLRNTLQDEKKLRMKRLKEFDERNIQVTLKAHYTAGALLLVAGYVVMLVSGFFSMEVFWTVWGMVMLYFLLFATARFIYEKRCNAAVYKELYEKTYPKGIPQSMPLRGGRTPSDKVYPKGIPQFMPLRGGRTPSDKVHERRYL